MADTPTTLPRPGLYRVRTLIAHNTMLLLRDPGPIVARIVMPAALLLVFEPLYRAALSTGTGDPAAEAASRVLVMFSLLSLSNVGTAMLDERTWRTWSRLRSTPTGAAELLIGKAVPLVGVILAQVAVVVLVARIGFGMRIGSPVLLAAGALAWALMILAVGMLIATFLNSTSQLVGVTDIGALLLSALGGAVVPLAMLPAWMAAVAPFSPPYWGLQVVLGAVSGRTGDVLTGTGVLLGIAVVAGTAACWRITRGWSKPEMI